MGIDVDRATVVAFYGKKPQVLVDLIAKTQAAASAALHGRFHPKPMDDIHATLIGLDQRTVGYSTQSLGLLLRHLYGTLQQEQLILQFGGFSPADRTILSRGRSLHERTLGIVGGHLVLIGWPVTDPEGKHPLATLRLADLRYQFEHYGLRHKYHSDHMEPDPDAYMVLGEVQHPEESDPSNVRAAAQVALATRILIPLGERDINIVEYSETSLSRATSKWWSLDSAIIDISSITSSV